MNISITDEGVEIMETKDPLNYTTKKVKSLVNGILTETNYKEHSHKVYEFGVSILTKNAKNNTLPSFEDHGVKELTLQKTLHQMLEDTLSILRSNLDMVAGLPSKLQELIDEIGDTKGDLTLEEVYVKGYDTNTAKNLLQLSKVLVDVCKVELGTLDNASELVDDEGGYKELDLPKRLEEVLLPLSDGDKYKLGSVGPEHYLTLKLYDFFIKDDFAVDVLIPLLEEKDYNYNQDKNIIQSLMEYITTVNGLISSSDLREYLLEHIDIVNDLLKEKHIDSDMDKLFIARTIMFTSFINVVLQGLYVSFQSIEINLTNVINK